MESKKLNIFVIFVFTILIVIPISLFVATGCHFSKKTELVFADASSVWWTAPTIIAQKYFEENNVKVQTFDLHSGLASKNAVVAGTADIGLVASPPLAKSAYEKESIIVLCSYVESKSLISLVTKKTGDITDHSFKNGVVPPIAIVPATISHIYFHEYLKEYVPDKKVNDFTILDSRPPDILNHLKKGSANSAVIWEPHVTKILDLKNKDFIAMKPDSDIYTLRLFLITRPDVLKKKRNAVKAFVSALNKACNFISEKPDEALGIICDKYDYEKSWLKSKWDEVDFVLGKDFEMMKQIILNDAKSLIELELIPKDTLPDIDYLFIDSFILD